MRRLYSAILLILVASAVAGAQPRTLGPYRTMELPNGLEVVVIEDHTTPLVTLDITVRTGAFTEPDELAGLSHLYEHMFFKANAAIPSQEKFMKRLRQLGIVFNGYTAEGVVTYFFTLPAKNLEPGMEFMSNAIKAPLFDSTELVKEREVVIGEFDRNESHPEFVLRYALDSALWMPYVSRKQPLGQRDVILTAGIEKMMMIKERFYLPNNAALIVSGAVKAEQVFGLARKYLGDWQRGPDPFPTHSPPGFPVLRPKLVVRALKIPDVVIRMAFHGPSVDEKATTTHAGQLLAAMLRQPTSRFYHNLVDSGLVTGFGVWLDNSVNTGSFQFYLKSPPEKAREAYRVLRGEIDAMARPGYFGADELAAAKQIMRDAGLFERDNIHSFATQTTARWWSTASLDYYVRFPEVVATLPESAVTEFVRTYVHGKPFVLGVGARQDVLDQLDFSEEALKW